MKKGLIILMLGLVAAAATYGCIYFVCSSSARNMQASERPELTWLRDEFKLTDAEFKRVSDLHAAYLPQCRERCVQIDQQSVQLQKLLAVSTNVTPEIERSLAETSRLRAECQAMMLRHFFQVSQAMPQDQGRRYLAWVKEKAFAPNFDMPEK
ncbi:MAG TPA: hypothetical protein VNU68_13080 [Verrucomicrobiae bacterium]|nr:hypothetical protein [Verrucomicrobiae bacterium]